MITRLYVNFNTPSTDLCYNTMVRQTAYFLPLFAIVWEDNYFAKYRHQREKK